MKKLCKHALALLCCLCMMLALVPTASAASTKKVLFIGSDYTNDNIFYLSELAHLTGSDIDVALVQHKGADLRTLSAAVYQNAALTYSEANASTEYKLKANGTKSIADALKAQSWDIVVLQNEPVRAAIKAQHNSDLKYMTDVVEDLAPNAKIYWNTAWALEDNTTTINGDFNTYFDRNTTAHYNSILNVTKEKIASNKSFDGIIYTGTAIQNARATTLAGNLLRGKTENLTFKEGRLIASLAVLKGIYPSANLGKVTVSALDKILTNSGEPADAYENNDANLNLVKSCITSGEPQLLPYTTTVKTNTNAGVITVAQEDYPNKLHFPDVTVMDNGDVFVAAYNNIRHYPVGTNVPSHEKSDMSALPNQYGEGAGEIVFYKSSDNGQTFQKLSFVIDEAQLEAWGLCELSNRYAKLKEDPNYNFCYCFDARDPNVKNVHCDVNGDGKKESILFLTFWVRMYNVNTVSTNGRTFCLYSTDGGETWTKPQVFSVGVKRGDVTELADGSILMPTYSPVRCNKITFDKDGKMSCKTISTIADGKWDSDSADGMEASFVSINGSNTVFTMIRNSGIVMRSDDGGYTWTELYNIPGEAYQPGFTQIDDERIYMTYSYSADPREVRGKVIYINGAYTDTGDKTIYGVANSVEDARDCGDPSCATLKDGRVFTVTYDTYYRSIVGTIEDPNNDSAYARTSVSPAYQAVPTAGMAYASKQSVDLDGTATEFDMYMLVDENGGETNYIKLRDIAYLLSGTKAKFEVKFNAKDNSITLVRNKTYTANGSEMSTPFSGNRAFKASSSLIKLNGENQVISGITLTDNAGGEYNYFKLRDLGNILGFSVDWSAERGIFVDTTKK